MTAEEVLRKRFTEPFEDDFYAIVEAMKLYANQKLDEAAEMATCSDASWTAMPNYTVDQESILKLKDEI